MGYAVLVESLLGYPDLYIRIDSSCLYFFCNTGIKECWILYAERDLGIWMQIQHCENAKGGHTVSAGHTKQCPPSVSEVCRIRGSQAQLFFLSLQKPMRNRKCEVRSLSVPAGGKEARGKNEGWSLQMKVGGCVFLSKVLLCSHKLVASCILLQFLKRSFLWYLKRQMSSTNRRPFVLFISKWTLTQLLQSESLYKQIQQKIVCFVLLDRSGTCSALFFAAWKRQVEMAQCTGHHCRLDKELA